MKKQPAFLERTDLKLLFFGGKGGVGKTTCATATALQLAGRFPEKRFLIASTDPAHSLHDSFAGGKLPPNLQLLEVDAQECLREFKTAHAEPLRAIALQGTFLDESDVGQLLDLSMPGLDELMAFHEIATLVESGAYGCIVVDTAPTGHTLRFLGLFEVMRRWLAAVDALLAKHRFLAHLYCSSAAGDASDTFLDDMHDRVEHLASLLTDPHRCLFVPVLLAEPISITQTKQLVDQLKALHIPVADLVVNRLVNSRPGCPVCENVRSRQRQELRRAVHYFTSHTLWEVPRQGAEVQGLEALAGFWEDLRPLQECTEEIASGLTSRVEPMLLLPDGATRLVLFAGKGGVGKTTLACATALRLSQDYPGKRVLLLSTDPAHSLAGCLRLPVGSRPVTIAAGLTALELDAASEFAKLKTQYADEIGKFFDTLAGDSGFDLEFDRDALEHLLDLAPPGLDEVMALTQAVELLEKGTHDLFVIDTAPAGHLIRMLELPDLIRDWLQMVFGLFLKYKNLLRLPRINSYLVSLSKGIKNLQSMLRDSCTCRLYTVSVLTEMSFEKTRDLLAACRVAGIHVPAIFLNQATPRGDCSLCNSMASVESRHRNRFAEAFRDIPQAVVYRCDEPMGCDRLSQLGQALYLNRSSKNGDSDDCSKSAFPQCRSTR